MIETGGFLRITSEIGIPNLNKHGTIRLLGPMEHYGTYRTPFRFDAQVRGPTTEI